MQPKLNTVWFAKMRESRKLLFFDNYSMYQIENFILSTGFAGLEVNDYALYYILSIISSKTFEILKDNISIGTTMQAINNEEIMKINIINPPKLILSKFNYIVKPIYHKIYKNNQQILNLNNTRDTLLPKLMLGEIRV